MTGIFIPIFISVLMLSGVQMQNDPGDPVAQDEAAVMLHIVALQNSDSDIRATAAFALRRIVAKYPSGTSNIRKMDGGEADWAQKISQIKKDMTLAQVQSLVPRLEGSGDTFSAPNSEVGYRLDNSWMVVIPYKFSLVASTPKLIKRERIVQVTPPQKYSGTWIQWYTNGQMASEIQYTNGRVNGSSAFHYDNGQKSVEQHYAGNNAEGADQGWYRDGQKMYVGQYRHGLRNGTWTHWFPNGNLQLEEQITDGNLDGLYTGWYDNGQKRFEINYKNGVKDGIEMGWNEGGALQYSRKLKDGQVVE